MHPVFRRLWSGCATSSPPKAPTAWTSAYRLREDGRALHPVYLLEAKQPSDSKNPWDVAKVLATTPIEEAFRPLNEGNCPLVKK